MKLRGNESCKLSFSERLEIARNLEAICQLYSCNLEGNTIRDLDEWPKRINVAKLLPLHFHTIMLLHI